MPDKLLREPQSFAIDHPVFTDRNRIRKIGAQRKTSFPQPFDIAHETERAGAGKLVAEYAWAHFVDNALTTDEGSGEIDFDIEMETGMGSNLAPAIAVLNTDRL